MHIHALKPFTLEREDNPLLKACVSCSKVSSHLSYSVSNFHRPHNPSSLQVAIVNELSILTVQKWKIAVLFTPWEQVSESKSIEKLPNCPYSECKAC